MCPIGPSVAMCSESGCCKLDTAHDFAPGRDATANARVSRQRKAPKAFRRQKFDICAQLARIGGKRLQAPYDPADLRRPCVGGDQYSHLVAPLKSAAASAVS